MTTRSETLGFRDTLRSRPVLCYGAAVVLVIVTTLLRQHLTRWVGPVALPFIAYYPSLFLAAWALGTGPTLLTTALSALAADFLFTEPTGQLAAKTPVGLVGLAIFGLVGIGISVLGDREHRARRLAESRADDNERLRANLAAVVEQLPIGLVMRASDDGRVLLSNSRMRELFGRDPVPDMTPEHLNELAGSLRQLDGDPVRPEELPVPLVFRTGRLESGEVECVHPDGRRVVLHLEASPVRNKEGAVTAGILTMADVTERRKSEDALRFLADASAALGTSLDYEATLATVAQLAVPSLADCCAVDLAEPDGRLRRIAMAEAGSGREASAREETAREPDGGSPSDPASGDGAYRVLQSGEAVFVPDVVANMLEHAPPMPGPGIASYIGVPLAAHGQVFGVISLIMSDKGSGRRYTPADLRLAQALGQRAGTAVDNARRHQQAIESANMLNAVLAASPVGQAFVDRELRYVHVNPALARLHGVPVEGHANRPIRDVLPAWAEALEPLHRQVFETGTPILDRELTVPAPAGGVYHLLVTCFPVLDAAGSIRWVGVTKANITGLRASEARLRRVVESPLIGIGFYDRGGRINGANQALAGLLGYTTEEIAAGHLRWDEDLTPAEYRHLDRDATRQIEATGVSRAYAKELLRKDGTRVPVLAGATRLDDDGRTGVFYILDLTDRRRMEEQAQAAQRLEAVGRLAGGVAHEINNALQGVLGFNTFILRRLNRDDPARGDAEQVQRAAERAARITQQLLAYSRRQVLQPLDLEVARLVTDFSPMLRQALGPERMLIVEPAADDTTVHADRTQLEQVLVNLTLNARDAMPDGGELRIRIDRAPISDEWAAQHGAGRLIAGDYVRLTVTDTGIGMDAETRARVFEPFFTTKPVGQGTGLGLSVVHGIVQQSGGHVWAYGEPGRGTMIRVLLPAVRQAPRAESAGAEGHDRSRAPLPMRGGGETILVVDDEPVVLAFAGSLLREAGYHVLQAADASQALALFRAEAGRGGAVALVVTDLVMPGMGGRALGEEIERMAPGLPVLYSSGYTGDEVARRGLVAEGVEFLAKPFSPEELLERVRAMLDRVARDA